MTENSMYHVKTSDGIKVMSLNLLMENEEDPVLWRGPIISQMVKQFWTDVLWEELDSLTNVKSLTFRLFTDKEEADNHCNVGNCKLSLNTILNWIEEIKK